MAFDGETALLGSDNTRNATGAAFVHSLSAPPPTGQPSAPVNLRATVSGSTVSLAWGAPTSGTPIGYVVEGGTAPGQTLASIPTGSTATSFAFDAPTGSFYVRVHATTASGRSPASNEVVVTVPSSCRRPPPPANFIANVSGSIVTLSWDPVAGAVQYIIEAGSASDTSELATLTVGPSPTIFSVVAPAGVYSVHVRAVTACGRSSPSYERRLRVGGSGPTSITVNDTATTSSDEEVVIPVLANDRLSLGGSLSIVSVTQPPNGTADANPDGTITYAPVDEFVGREQFTYSVEDEHGGFDTGTVTVDVTAPAPDARAALDTAPIVGYVTRSICTVDQDLGLTYQPGGWAFMQELGASGVNEMRMNFKIYKPDKIKTGADFQTGTISSGTFPNDAQSYRWEYGGAVTISGGYIYKVMVKMTWARPGSRRDHNRTRLVTYCDTR